MDVCTVLNAPPQVGEHFENLGGGNALPESKAWVGNCPTRKKCLGVHFLFVFSWPEGATASQLILEFNGLKTTFEKYKDKLTKQKKTKADIEKREVEAGEEEFEKYKLPEDVLTMEQAYQTILDAILLRISFDLHSHFNNVSVSNEFGWAGTNF